MARWSAARATAPCVPPPGRQSRGLRGHHHDHCGTDRPAGVRWHARAALQEEQHWLDDLTLTPQPPRGPLDPPAQASGSAASFSAAHTAEQSARELDTAVDDSQTFHENRTATAQILAATLTACMKGRSGTAALVDLATGRTRTAGPLGSSRSTR